MPSKSYWVEPVRNRTTGKIVAYKARYRLPDGGKRGKNFPVNGAAPGGAKRQAEDWLAERRRDRNYGLNVDDRAGRATFAEEADRWLASIATGIEASTYRDYEGLLRVWIKPRFGTWPLADIAYEDIQAFINELGGWNPREGTFDRDRAKLGASRIRRVGHILQTVLAEAVRRGRLGRSPYVKVRRPRSGTAAGRKARKMRWLSVRGVRLLAEAMPPRYHAAVFVMAWGGLRWGEFAGLRRESCELLPYRQLRVIEARKPGKGERYGETKDHQTRNVHLPAYVCELLEQHLKRFVDHEPQALLFTAPEGGALHYKNFVDRVWQPALARVAARGLLEMAAAVVVMTRATVPFNRERLWAPALEAATFDQELGLHDLRHTCASLLAAQGWTMHEVKEQLGHSSIAVTEKYTHFFPTHLTQKTERADATIRADLIASRGAEKPRRSVG